MNVWEKLKVISGFIAAVLVPIVVAYTGDIYSSAIKERELQGKFVELAVGILNEEPDPKNEAIRDWATNIINSYSGVPMGQAVKDELIKKRSLPLIGSRLMDFGITSSGAVTMSEPDVSKNDLQKVMKRFLSTDNDHIEVIRKPDNTFEVRAKSGLSLQH